MLLRKNSAFPGNISMGPFKPSWDTTWTTIWHCYTRELQETGYTRRHCMARQSTLGHAQYNTTTRLVPLLLNCTMWMRVRILFPMKTSCWDALIKIFLSDFHVFMGKFSCCWVFLQHSRTMRLRKTLPVQCTIRSHTSEWLYTEWPVMESCEFQLTVDNICVNTDTLTHVSGIFFFLTFLFS